MSLSRLSRRWVASIALVSYLLAATVSGMLHNHGDGDGHGSGDTCCNAGACAAVTDRNATDHKKNSTRCSHGHRHSHVHRSHAGHRNTADSSRKPDQPSRHHGPLRHADCAACQFLAQQSVTTPQVTLVVTADFTCAVSETVEEQIPTVIAAAHPARGPPASA